MKSLRLDIVKDPSDFPYYRVGLGQTKLNFAKIDDVLEFIKRHMTVDTDIPMVKGAQKEKQPTTTGVPKTTMVPIQEGDVVFKLGKRRPAFSSERRNGKGTLSDAEMMQLIKDIAIENKKITTVEVGNVATEEPYWKIGQCIGHLTRLGYLHTKDGKFAKNKTWYPTQELLDGVSR